MTLAVATALLCAVFIVARDVRRESARLSKMAKKAGARND